MKKKIDRRMIRLWLLREICLFLSGEISSDSFDDNIYCKKHRLSILSQDPTCYSIFWFFWWFYDDYRGRNWEELFDIYSEENRRTIKVIGDMLVMLTSEFDIYKERIGPIKRFKSIFLRQNATPSFYPFCSDWDRITARKRFFLDKDDYVPKIIPQSVFNIYICC